MSKNGSQSNLLTGYERLFVAVVKQAIRHKDFKFFGNGKCGELADFLGVNIDIADLIKNRVVKNFRNSAYFK